MPSENDRLVCEFPFCAVSSIMGSSPKAMNMRFIIVALVTLANEASCIPTVSEINKLSAKLMAGYNKNTLPAANFSEKFEVDIAAHVVALGDVDEIEERLSTVIMFIYAWNDASMKWNLSQHGNINNITMSWLEVWKPVLLVFNPHQDATHSHADRASMTVEFLNDGTGRFLELVTFQSTCNLDTTSFPFDIQTCSIKLYLSENDAYKIRVNAMWRSLENFSKENGAWKLVGRNIVGGENSAFTISFQLERKPLFMLVNILLPIIVLALLTPLVFLMPKRSGERVGFAITTLLAISVYMTIISEHLPKNSDPMPLVSIMIFVWYIMNSSTVFIVIMNTKINHIKDGRPLPMICEKFVHLTRKIGCVKKLKVTVQLKQKDECLDDDDATEKMVVNGNDGIKMEEPEVHQPVVVVTWQELSVAIDRWCFVLSYIVKITIPVVFLTVMKTNRPAHNEWS